MATLLTKVALIPDEPVFSRRLGRRLAIFGAATVAAAALLLLLSGAAPSVAPRLSFNRIPAFEHLPGRCADTASIPVTAPRANVWKNFDVQEAAAIRGWLWAYRDAAGNGLNLTAGLAATDFDNSILLIENFAPPKADVLECFDKNGTVPQRYAKVFLALGAASPPAFAQYLLGPLPNPITTLTMSLASLQLQPLKHIFTRPEIPYTARLYALNSTHVDTFLMRIVSPLQNATLDLLGGPIAGGRIPGGIDNHTSPDPSGLVFGASTPFSYDGAFRRIWFQLKQNTCGSYLKALDMYLYADLTAPRPEDWYLLRMVYNRQVFRGTEEFLQAYRNGTLHRSTPPPPPTSPSESTWASRTPRGSPRDLDTRAGPRQVSFNGPRVRVDTAEQYVTWLGWSFYLAFGRDMGLAVWDVRFRGERVLYEVAPQEAVAVYSGSDPHQGSTVFLDGGFGMGVATRPLIRGYDCPHDALLLPGITHAEAGSIRHEDAVCVFERDSGRPLSRHTGFLKGEMGAIKGYELTVRTISTVGNYDYLFEYTFQLDGTMEVRVSASGYLQGAWWDEAESEYGTRIRDTFMGSLHDHVINYKLDFDIAGTRNSLMAITLENEVVQQPWFADSDDDEWGQEVHQQKIVRTMVRNESDALLDWPRNNEGLYAIVNEEQTNGWGYPRGYAIHPGVSAIHLTNLESKRTRNNVNFAKHHLAVSRRKDSEPSSSSMWNINLPGAPPVDFYQFFNGESLEQEDLTAWVNLGMHHIPRAEDSPMTLTNIATSYVLLTPFNFNDWDPAMESMNAIVIDVPEPGEAWTGDENGVEIEYCVPPPVDKFQYSPLATFEEDGTPGTPKRVHEMRRQAESYHAIFAGTEL